MSGRRSAPARGAGRRHRSTRRRAASPPRASPYTAGESALKLVKSALHSAEFFGGGLLLNVLRFVAPLALATCLALLLAAASADAREPRRATVTDAVPGELLVGFRS